MITKPVADCYVYRCRSFSTVAFIAVCVRTGSIRPSENVYKVQFVSARRLVCIERRPLEVFRNLDGPHFQERNVLNSSLERVAFIVGSCLSFQRTGNFKPRSRLPVYFGYRSRMNLPFIWQRRAKRSGEPGEWQGAGDAHQPISGFRASWRSGIAAARRRWVSWGRLARTWMVWRLRRTGACRRRNWSGPCRRWMGYWHSGPGWCDRCIRRR